MVKLRCQAESEAGRGANYLSDKHQQFLKSNQAQAKQYVGPQLIVTNQKWPQAIVFVPAKLIFTTAALKVLQPWGFELDINIFFHVVGSPFKTSTLNSFDILELPC